MTVDVILFGIGRYGDGIARRLRKQGLTVLGVDFDPQTISAWQRQGHAAVYGDAEDPEFPATLPLAHARWVVCTIPVRQVNLALLHALRAHGFRGKVALTAHDSFDARLLEQQDANLVLRPFSAAADKTAETLAAEIALQPEGRN